MSLYPRKFDVYHISSIPRPAEYDSGGNRTFRGHGNDYSHETDNVIYIMSEPLGRVVAFKAFFENFKINLTKDLETQSDKDKDSILVRQYASKIDYDITLNIPAHSVNEAVNNIAKIEELQKLIAKTDKTITTGAYEFTAPEAITAQPVFKVFMKNLIFAGAFDAWNGRFGSNPDEGLLRKFGLPCIIQEVGFEPDVQSGFFEFKNYLYPKNIKLNLKLILDQTSERRFGGGAVVLPFDSKGNYSVDDRGAFPFGVSVSEGEPEENGLEIGSDFTSKTLNTLDFQNERQDTYIFISNGQDTTDTSKHRFVVFKSFIKNFSRTHKTDFSFLESKTLDINGGIAADKDVTFGGLKFSLSIDLPAKDVEEAKKNCGKLSYLTRMLFKKQNDETLVLKPGEKSKFNKGVFVYIPGMLEKAGASRFKPPHTNTDGMKSNAIPLFFENLSFDVDLTAGFFEDKGRLYPKVFSIDMSFFYASGELIKNFKYDAINEPPYVHIESGTIKGMEHLFPYNRQTFKIGE
mgnify:CR=1 FL=1